MAGNTKILIAGGGTGGHLFPALAIGDALRDRGAEVRYIGSTFGIEAKKLPALGEKPYLLPIRGIQRDLSVDNILKNLSFPAKFLKSYNMARNILKEFKPSVVVGTGGYASGVPLLAAVQAGINTLIQEQNSYPGITTRKLSGRVNMVCIAFEETANHLSGEWRITGNPIREGLKIMDKGIARETMGLDREKTTILLLGGSQGARPLNMHFRDVHQKYLIQGMQILWQSGERDAEQLKPLSELEGIHLHPFIEDMSAAYSSADLVIARAGALTISELTCFHKAAVFIPYPHAAGDHQTINARSLVSEGAALMITQDQLPSGKLEKTVFELARDSHRRVEMEKRARLASYPDATEHIIEEILNLV